MTTETSVIVVASIAGISNIIANYVTNKSISNKLKVQDTSKATQDVVVADSMKKQDDQIKEVHSLVNDRLTRAFSENDRLTTALDSAVEQIDTLNTLIQKKLIVPSKARKAITNNRNKGRGN